MHLYLSRLGKIRAGFTQLTPEDGFSGIVVIIMGAECPKRIRDKSKDGKQLGDTLEQSRKIASKEICPAAANKDKPSYTGLMIVAISSYFSKFNSVVLLV